MHSFHRTVTDFIAGHIPPGYEVIGDPACGGEQARRLQLFCSQNKTRSENFCWVDLLVVRNHEIRLIIEIEESSVTPVQICGKFLASALCEHFIHHSQLKLVPMARSAGFIQILNEAKAKDGGAKKEQWKALAKSIQAIARFTNISDYQLFWGRRESFSLSPGPDLVEYVSSKLVTLTRN
jgi:hypothetical protein